MGRITLRGRGSQYNMSQSGPSTVTFINSAQMKCYSIGSPGRSATIDFEKKDET